MDFSNLPYFFIDYKSTWLSAIRTHCLPAFFGAYILILSTLLVFSKLLFFAFFGSFSTVVFRWYFEFYYIEIHIRIHFHFYIF